MEELLPNTQPDAIRELLIIIIGLIIRAIEKRKMKAKDAES
jgi:hypothetical protein